MNKPNVLVLVILLVAACVPHTTSEVTRQPPPITTLVVQTSTPALAATVTDASNSLPPISTASPTPTTTLSPTLTEREREDRVLEWLETNAGCELPCWWGIMPGVTTWDETQHLLQSVGVRIFSEKKSDGTIVHETGGFDFDERSIYNGVTFVERAGVVDTIIIDAEAHLNPEGFQSAWIRYSPQNILKQYGIPSRVMIQSASSMPVDEAKPRVGYGLWLIYDHLGFLIGYSGVTKYEPIYHICPSFEGPEGIASLDAFLQSPDGQLPLDKAIRSYKLFPSYFHTFEEASGLSIDEFYARFTQSKTPACFDTPANIWP